MEDLESFLRKLIEEPDQPEQQSGPTEQEEHQGAQCHRDLLGCERKEIPNVYVKNRIRRIRTLPL
jgi:hypothetical protein